MKKCPLQFGPAGGEVSPLIFGQFIEHLDDCIDGGVVLRDTGKVNPPVLEKVRALAVPLLRFPGGTVANIYHWEDAVGPAEQRKRRKNLIWGGELSPLFGTAEFVEYCRSIGAEPIICINLASGTAEEAGNWVEYCNGTGNTYYADLRRSHGYDEPFRVKYWCIGNESNAEPDIGKQDDVAVYVRDAKECIKFMKLTDPTIRTVAVGCDDMQWNRAVLDGLGDMVDYLSYHHYSGGGDTLYGPFYGERGFREKLETLSSLLEEYPDTVENLNAWYRFPPRAGKIQIAVDEWNRWDYHPGGDYGLHPTYSWRDALWTASVLNDLIACPRVGLANMAQLVNVLAPIVTVGDSAAWQVTALPLLEYRWRMTGKRLAVAAQTPTIEDNLEAVSVCAVQCDEEIRMAVVNRDAKNEITLALPGEYSYTASIYTAPWDAVDSEAIRPNEISGRGTDISLPPCSIALLSLT